MADAAHRSAGVHTEPLVAQHLRDQFTRLRLLPRNQAIGPFDNVDPGAEPGERLGQFEPDRAATDHDQRRGRPFDADGVAVGPVRRVAKPVDGRNRGLGAAVDHDRACDGELLTVVDRDRMGPGDPSVPADEVAALALEPVDGDLVVPVVGGLGPDPLEHRRVVRVNLDTARQFRDTARLGQRVRGADHHLARHAPVVRAFATDEVLVDPHHRESGLGELPGDGLPSWAHSDHDDVDGLGHLCHLLESVCP